MLSVKVVCKFLKGRQNNTNYDVFVCWLWTWWYLPFILRKVTQNWNSKKDTGFGFDEKQLKPGRYGKSYIEQGLNWVGNWSPSWQSYNMWPPYSVLVVPDGYCLNEIAMLINKITIIYLCLKIMGRTASYQIYRLPMAEFANSKNKQRLSLSGDFFHKICQPWTCPKLLDATRLQIAMKELEPLVFNCKDLFLVKHGLPADSRVFDEA